MSQHYQSKRLVDCHLPRDMFKRVSAVIEGYPRMRTELAFIRGNIIHGTARINNQPKAPGIGDPTAHKAIRLAKLTEELECIETAVAEVNAIYAQKMKRQDMSSFDAVSAFMDYGYFCFAMYRPEDGREPARRTWSYFKTLLAYKVAENMNLI